MGLATEDELPVWQMAISKDSAAYDAITMHDYEAHGIGLSFSNLTTDAVAHERVLEAADLPMEDVMQRSFAEPEVSGIRLSLQYDLDGEMRHELSLEGEKSAVHEAKAEGSKNTASASVYSTGDCNQRATKRSRAKRASPAQSNDSEVPISENLTGPKASHKLAEKSDPIKKPRRRVGWRKSVNSPTYSPARDHNANALPIEGAFGYNAFRNMVKNGDTMKRRGRPVGWKQSMYSRAAQEKKRLESRAHADSRIQSPLNTITDFRVTRSRVSREDSLASTPLNYKKPLRNKESYRKTAADCLIEGKLTGSENSINAKQPRKKSIELEGERRAIQSAERSRNQEVFASYELIEQILLNADVSTVLLRAQQVSRTFRHIIKRSTRLQQKLFFKPVTPYRWSGQITWNPLFLKRDHAVHCLEMACSQPSHATERIDLLFPYSHDRDDMDASWRRMHLFQGVSTGHLQLKMVCRDNGMDIVSSLVRLKVDVTAGELVAWMQRNFREGRVMATSWTISRANGMNS